MADISFDKQSSPVRIVGGGTDGESNKVNVTPIEEISSSDILNNGGTSDLKSIGTTPIEVMVSTSKKSNRKLIMFQFIDTDGNFGFSSGSQPFLIKKEQIVMLSVGDNTEVWVKAKSNGKLIAIAEL